MIEDEDSAADVLPKALPANVPQEVLDRHRQVNRTNGWNYLLYTWQGLEEVILLGGGPSLNTHSHELDELLKRQIPVVTVNGSYHWALERYIYPHIQIVLDAREWNKVFTHPAHPGTHYLIADTCHPEVFKGLPKKHTHMWQPESVSGGSTVMLNAIPLLRKMGMQYCSIFGFDSCVTDEHHAYAQPENDKDDVIEVDIDERLFKASRWQIQQAEEFLQLHSGWGNFKVHGDGMIAWMLRE